MKRSFALFLVAIPVLACSSSYSRLEVQAEGSDQYTRFDGRRTLEVGVGWSGRFRAVDTSADTHFFDLRSADEKKLVVAPVAKDPKKLDADERAEAGIVFAFLPRAVGTTDVDVVVDGVVEERIKIVVSRQR